MGPKLCGEPLSFHHHETANSLPEPKSKANPLGRHLDGCRIGFDLGGSDRKTAAVIDGKVVFSEEVPWDPYFEADPNYHLEGIRHSLKRAAEHLPQVDAIGGSAAGNYMNSVVRVVKTLAFVNSTEDFVDQPAVINGCSDLFADLYGQDAGVGARSAQSSNSLPGGMAVEVEMILEVSL